MAQHKAPAFQFYAGDFLSDDNVCLMTNEQVGAYVLLLCHQWARPEGLPEALSSLAKLARCTTARFERVIWPAVLPCFHQNELQRWFNSRLEEVRAEQRAFVERQRAAGRASAAVRAKWQPDGNHGSTTVPTDPPTRWQPAVNSLSLSSLSTRTPPTPLVRGARRITNPEFKNAADHRRRIGGCTHGVDHDYATCVRAFALELRGEAVPA